MWRLVAASPEWIQTVASHVELLAGFSPKRNKSAPHVARGRAAAADAFENGDIVATILSQHLEKSQSARVLAVRHKFRAAAHEAYKIACIRNTAWWCGTNPPLTNTLTDSDALQIARILQGGVDVHRPTVKDANGSVHPGLFIPTEDFRKTLDHGNGWLTTRVMRNINTSIFPPTAYV